MEVSEQLVNEALTILPELIRALLAGKPRHHPHYQQWRAAGLLKDEDEAPARADCPADVLPDEPGQSFAMPWHRPGDIPVAQIKLMSYLALRGPQTMSEVAEGLEVTTPAITGLVDKLEKRGLVERLRDSQDRRVVRVQLCSPAQMIAQSYIAERRRQIRTVLATLTPEEQHTFVKTLKLLAETMYPKASTETPIEEKAL